MIATGPAWPGARYGFTSRSGGVSVGPLASLNLALRADETRAALTENWRRVRAQLTGDPEAPLALLSQVHGAEVLTVEAPTGPLATAGAADAAVTTVPGLILAVRVADCVPVLLAAPGGIGVAHAGWRGTAAGVVPAAVQALCEATGQPPSAVHAAIGPHISAPAYETGPEVVDALVAAGLSRDRVERRGPTGREHADLGAAVGYQLAAAGVREVVHLGGCTATEPRYFSHRRDGPATGRQAGVVVWTGGRR